MHVAIEYYFFFCLVCLQYGRRPKLHCNQNSHAMTKWIPFAFFTFSPQLGSFLLVICCRTFPMNLQYLFSKIPFYPDQAETALRQFSVKLQCNLRSDCITYLSCNKTHTNSGAPFFHSVILIQSTFDSEFGVRQLHSLFVPTVSLPLRNRFENSQKHFGTAVSMQKK